MKVLPDDIKMARQLYECCCSCLERARLELRRDKLSEADNWITEYSRAKRDLDKLIKKKEERDRLELLVEELRNQGFDAMLIEGKLSKI